MNFHRTYRPDDLSTEAFDYQVLYDGESCVITICRAPAATDGPRPHRHTSDQLYYVIEGAMELEMAGEDQTVGAGSTVFIPADTPHTNRYAGPELHLDIIAPAPSHYEPIARPVDDHGAGSAAQPASFVLRAGSGRPREVLPGFTTTPLAGRGSGCGSLSLRVNEIEPGHEPLPWHIHDFDQFYFILDGQMQVEVASERFVASPLDLVALPAGVPHRNWNAGPGVERHLAMLVPEPEAGSPADLEVEFRVTGSTFG